MFQVTQKLTFDEFLKLRPEDGRFELIDGKIVRILATRQHENVADFIMFALNDENRRLGSRYKVSDRIAIATSTPDGSERGRHPDVSVVERTIYDSNLLAYSALREPIAIAVEVVSTNWEDDYIDKLDEYQRLGILEYWVVDYLAIASRTYLGNPKTPTVFVYQLVDGIYQSRSFTGSDKIVSSTFGELELTVDQIVASST